MFGFGWLGFVGGLLELFFFEKLRIVLFWVGRCLYRVVGERWASFVNLLLMKRLDGRGYGRGVPFRRVAAWRVRIGRVGSLRYGCVSFNFFTFRSFTCRGLLTTIV